MIRYTHEATARHNAAALSKDEGVAWIMHEVAGVPVADGAYLIDYCDSLQALATMEAEGLHIVGVFELYYDGAPVHLIGNA